MSSTPVPDQETYYSSRRQDDVDALAWPVFSQHALDLLRSAGEVLHPEPGELLWDAGDRTTCTSSSPAAYFSWTAETTGWSLSSRKATSSGEGMLMGQRAFLPGVAMKGTAVLRVRVEELRRLVAISGELSDVLLSAFDARRRLLRRMGEGVSYSPETTTATCTGFRNLPSATNSRTGRCCVRTRRLGQSWRRPLRCLRRARLW